MPRPDLATAFLLSIIAAVFVLASCGGDSGETDAQADHPEQTIAIGSIFSTTGAGVAFGPQQVRASKLAINEVNAEELAGGHDLRLVQRDDESNPKRSAEVMRNLIEDEDVIAVLGPTFSNSAAEAHPVANEHTTPVLSVSNTGEGIVGKCDYRCDFSFRDSLGEAEAIPANIRSWLAEHGDPSALTAVVVHPTDDPFGAQTAQIASNAFKVEGLSDAPVHEGPNAVQQGLRGNPDALMITASSGEAAAEMLIEAREAGFKGRILGGNAFNSKLASGTAAELGDGAQSASAWFAGNDSQANRDFVHTYRAAYGEVPDQFAAQAYTGVMLLAAAVADLGEITKVNADTREQMAHALASVELDTPLGPFRFTAEHDVSQPIWIVEMNGHGQYSLVEEVAQASS